MKVVITGRKVELKDSFKELVEKKLSKFDRMFDENTMANVTVTVTAFEASVEPTYDVPIDVTVNAPLVVFNVQRDLAVIA